MALSSCGPQSLTATLGRSCGTLLVVSHDREFLDNVVTSTLVSEGEGKVKEYAGGYADWRCAVEAEAPTTPAKRADKAAKPRSEAEGPRRRTFKEKLELEELPARIEALEERKAALEARMVAPGFNKRPGEVVSADTAAFEALGRELESAYVCWEEFEGLRE